MSQPTTDDHGPLRSTIKSSPAATTEARKGDRGGLGLLFRIADAIPMKFMFLIIFVCLWKQEWYPFSHFPMYSSFGRHGVYYFVTDEADTPIACQGEFGMSAMSYNKYLRAHIQEISRNSESELTQEEVEAEASDRFLRQLLSQRLARSNAEPEYQKLKLWKVDLALDRERRSINESTTLAAEVTVP